MRTIGFAWMAAISLVSWNSAVAAPTHVDRLLAQENAGKTVKAVPIVDDLAFLRRVAVDLVGRIPSEKEIQQFLAWPAAERRNKAIDLYLADSRFVERWTVFYADMLRIRANAQGGQRFLAYVYQAVKQGMPHDEMCRRLIAANGKPNQVPEVGYVLGDDVDPMALAGATSQVFMGVRVACAQCHDHPFDVWKREQFYGFAAYFGKTRRMVTPITETLYTTEADETMILWPPAEVAKDGPRKPVTPAFPFAMDTEDRPSKPIARLQAVRDAAAARVAASSKKGPTVDDLLVEADAAAKDRTQGTKPQLIDVVREVKQQAQGLNIYNDLYRPSQYRRELAAKITSPYNRYFSRSFVNRVWKDLVGRGFVEPVDDFSDENQPSHPETLDYLADEFVASGFDLKTLLRLIAGSEAYQRGHLVTDNEKEQMDAEAAFVANSVRRMQAEALYDSMALAGHVLELKFTPGMNQKTIKTAVQEAVIDENEPGSLAAQLALKKREEMKTAMAAMAKPMAGAGGYDLEKAIEVDFDKVLNSDSSAPLVEQLAAMSKEELQAMEEMKRMEAMKAVPGVKYVTKMVESVVDDNPRFASAMRMASPADPSHFLRVFGQPSRDGLGEHRDDYSSMRQALMMLNGKLTHDASRVGNLEPIYPLLTGPKANLTEAVRLAYREILTREPTAEESAEAIALIQNGPNPVEGMADLRWVLFNCHEFRFLP